MDYLPLHFDLKARKVVIVGGGDIAIRKARLISAAGAVIHIVAPKIRSDLHKLALETGGLCETRRYQPLDLDGVMLAIGATDDLMVNKQLYNDAVSRNIPVNVVDTPALCTVIFPAIVDRSPLILSVSSGGASPVLTRKVRERLEMLIPAGYQRIARYLGEKRELLKTRFSDPDQRRKVVETLFDGPAATQLMSGNSRLADELLENPDSEIMSGEVYLVGAGPGDPDLLTLRALQVMQLADVVLYDNLVSTGILDKVRRDADLIYVGKKRADHSIRQEDLNLLLVKLAKEGKRVLRLKGGDPFIFGRGGEEISELAEHQVPFQVIPGITAATGCASYAGIPLTHRDYSQSVRFVTGHPKNGELSLDWSELAHESQTLVFYMGLVGLEIICRELMSHGLRGSMPAAIISKGTLPDQQVLVADLATLAGKVDRAIIKSPTLIIVGEVVRLRERLGQVTKQSELATREV